MAVLSQARLSLLLVGLELLPFSRQTVLLGPDHPESKDRQLVGHLQAEVPSQLADRQRVLPCWSCHLGGEGDELPSSWSELQWAAQQQPQSSIAQSSTSCWSEVGGCQVVRDCCGLGPGCAMRERELLGARWAFRVGSPRPRFAPLQG